jgi:hypothetical protein
MVSIQVHWISALSLPLINLCRHRFTAAVIGLWISANYDHPHRSFRDLVKLLTSYVIKEVKGDLDELVPVDYPGVRHYSPFIDTFKGVETGKLNHLLSHLCLSSILQFQMVS